MNYVASPSAFLELTLTLFVGLRLICCAASTPHAQTSWRPVEVGSLARRESVTDTGDHALDPESLRYVDNSERGGE